MSTKTKFITSLQILISFILFMIALFIFFTDNNILLFIQLLVSSFLFGLSSFIVFIKKFENIISSKKIQIFSIIGWVFSLSGIYLNFGIWSFGITLFVISMIMSYNLKGVN